MKSRTRSRKPASIGSNHSSRRPTAISASEPRTGSFVLLLVMAWSPPAHNAGIVGVSAPGDYATFNSNHTPDGTNPLSSNRVADLRMRVEQGGPQASGWAGTAVLPLGVTTLSAQVREGRREGEPWGDQ